MPTFFCRLHPPRSDFAMTMSASEKALMGRHAAYLGGLGEQGTAVLFGPIGDPSGPWGLLILECADATEASALTANDPVIQSNQGFRYEVHPMLNAILRKSLR